jgi:RND superfamily putative drug exporter
MSISLQDRGVRPAVDEHGALGHLARMVLRHRRMAGFFWLTVGVVGVLLVGPIGGRLAKATTFPGLPSYTAGEAIVAAYGTGGSNSPTVAVVTLPAGQQVESPVGAREVASTFAALTADRSLRVVSYPAVPDRRLVSEDGRSTVGIVFGGDNGPLSAQVAARMRADAPAGVAIAATSLTDLYNAPGSGGIGVLGEAGLGAIGALVVMALIFGSLLAVIPLIVAAVSILGTFLALGAVTTVTDVSQLVEYLVTLVGLGVAIDYSLLVVTRWREERARGCGNEDAVVVAMATAGRAVVFSGVTVAVGLFSLVLLPIPFLRSFGYGGLLIPLITVVAAMTLLPVLLSAWGPRLDRRGRRKIEQGGPGSSGGPSRGWTAWTRAVIAHRLAAIAVAAVVLGVLIAVASGIRVGEVRPTSVARSGPAESGLNVMRHAGFPLGLLDPIEILVEHRDPDAVVGRLAAIPGVDTVVAPDRTGWRRDGTALVDVFPTGPTSTPAGNATVGAVRHTLHRIAPGARVAGDGPLETDIVHAYYARFPLIVAVVALVSFLALAWAWRSVVLALKAVALNVVSVTAAFGAAVLVWQDGYGSRALWGIPATGVVVDFVPLLVFAFLFGLSMDYEVFIVSRIKEAHEAGMSTDDAIVEGLGRTGRLVTAAATILFLAFVALAAGPAVPVKVFATAMAVGVVLDATVIRALFVPALVSLLGPANWWTPRRRRQSLIPVVGENQRRPTAL